MTWRGDREPSRIASRQALTAAIARRLAQRPSSIVRRPASIRFASAASPSRVRSGLPPTSRRYNVIGSSVRTRSSPLAPATAPGGPGSSSASPLSVAAMPGLDETAVASSTRSAPTPIFCRSLPEGEGLGQQRIRIGHGPEGATPSDHRASAGWREKKLKKPHTIEVAPAKAASAAPLDIVSRRTRLSFRSRQHPDPQFSCVTE